MAETQVSEEETVLQSCMEEPGKGDAEFQREVPGCVCVFPVGILGRSWSRRCWDDCRLESAAAAGGAASQGSAHRSGGHQKGAGGCRAAGRRGKCPPPQCCRAVFQGKCADWLSGCQPQRIAGCAPQISQGAPQLWGLKALVDLKAESGNEASGDRRSGQDDG